MLAMTTTDYIINAILVLLVVRQIRERRLDLQSLLLPVVLVGLAARQYLHSVPTAGNDLVLVGALGGVGATLGILCALSTHVRLGADGVALARAGWVAAALWIGGIGSRMAFAYAAAHGAGPAIGRFSVVHHITGGAAWTAALVLMALAEVVARLVTLQARGHLASGPGAAARLAGASA
jgi:hypothetical protein